MKKKLLSLGLCCALALSLCLPGFAEEDTSAPGEPDSSASTPDSSTPDPDASAPDPDVSTPDPDTSTPDPDESTPIPDESAPAPDTSILDPDASAPDPDVSTPDPEAPDDSELPDDDLEDLEEPEEPEEPLAEEDLIQVQVPASGRVIVNPYRMKVNVGGTEATGQVLHIPQTIYNDSPFPVSVSVSALGRPDPGSEAVFAETPPTRNTRDKALFLYMELQPEEAPDWVGNFLDLENQLLITEYGSGKADMFALDAGDVTPAGARFGLFGSAASAPSDPWNANDTFHVTLTFTFTPL